MVPFTQDVLEPVAVTVIGVPGGVEVGLSVNDGEGGVPTVKPAVAESVLSLIVSVPVDVPLCRVNVAVCAPTLTDRPEMEAPVPPDTEKVVPLVHDVLLPVAVTDSEAPVYPVVGEIVNDGVGGELTVKLAVAESVESEIARAPVAVPLCRVKVAVCAPTLTDNPEMEAPLPPETENVVPLVQDVPLPVAVTVSECRHDHRSARS